MMPIIAVVDSDKSFRQSLQQEVRKHITKAEFLEFENGFDLIKHCCNCIKLPKIVFTEVFASKIDGVALTDYLSEYMPEIHVVGLSNQMNTEILKDMTTVGAKTFICKKDVVNFFTNAYFMPFEGTDTHIRQLDLNFFVTTMHVQHLERKKLIRLRFNITKREAVFIGLNATGLEYHEIADLMFISPKTVDNLFANVSKKLGVKNRHNLTLFSLRHGLTKIATFYPVMDLGVVNILKDVK